MLPVILGISGLCLSNEEKDLFHNYNPSGVILFKRNISDVDQIKKLTAEIKNISPNTKIWIDQEGGRVCRLTPPNFMECPEAWKFAVLYKENPQDATEAVYDNYFQITKSLLALGIDANCAPVADLRHAGAHDIIGDRSFGDNVAQVVNLCKAALSAIKDAGGISVIKHIPGHGRAFADSHLELPVVDTELAELEITDFLVFKELSSFAEYAMTAHVIFTGIDSDFPVTVSEKSIKYIRQNLSFSGKIMTDALEMQALNGDIKDRALKALQAGCDILLECTGKIENMREVISSYIEFSGFSK